MRYIVTVQDTNSAIRADILVDFDVADSAYTQNYPPTMVLIFELTDLALSDMTNSYGGSRISYEILSIVEVDGDRNFIYLQTHLPNWICSEGE
jgi:hypothetical protein